jgi:hypothetical protein
MGKKYDSLKDLEGLISTEDRQALDEQAEYQKEWRDNKFRFREMVAKKNRKWIEANSQESDFVYYKEFPDVYAKIEDLFSQESKRKWMLHIMTNFVPLNKACQVPKLPSNISTCCIAGYELTDMKSIMTGDRDKHIGFTGERTNIILSGIALQEIHRYVIDRTYDFDSQAGHIINYAFDQIRTKDSPKKSKKK